MPWTMNDAPDLTGKTILVTGSNTGIGYETARLLAQKGATIVMACRNREKGEQALQRLKATVPMAQIDLVQLDLASLASVRSAAAEVNARYGRLDVLINNAGLMMPPLQRTADGFELQFGTNVLGPFAFTGLLLPLLNRTPDARVVWLSSVAHWVGGIDFDNLNAEKRYSRWEAYAQSKLANLVLAYEMQRRLQRSGATTISLCVHPGGTQSELARDAGPARILFRFLQTTAAGALPSIRAAVDPAARGGEFYGPGGFATIAGAPTKQRSSRRSRDEALAARLWQACEQLTGVSWLN